MNDRQYGDLMEKIGEISADVKSLIGNGQPGRMTKAEARIDALEDQSKRRTWIEHAITIFVAGVVSAVFALHEHLFAWLGFGTKVATK